MAFDVVLEWRGEEVAAEFVDVALDAIEAAAHRSRAAILEAWRSSMPVLTGRMKASAQLDIERTRETIRLHFRVVTYWLLPPAMRPYLDAHGKAVRHSRRLRTHTRPAGLIPQDRGVDNPVDRLYGTYRRVSVPPNLATSLGLRGPRGLDEQQKKAQRCLPIAGLLLFPSFGEPQRGQCDRTEPQ